jgi:hypothetical protein
MLRIQKSELDELVQPPSEKYLNLLERLVYALETIAEMKPQITIAPAVPAQVTLPPMQVTLPQTSVVVQPPVVNVAAPNVTVEPSPVSVAPPSITVQPSPVNVAPPAITVTPAPTPIVEAQPLKPAEAAKNWKFMIDRDRNGNILSINALAK